MLVAKSDAFRHRFWHRLSASLVAGGIAIAINTFILFAADWIPLATAHGGLLKLIKPFVSGPLHTLRITYAWQRLGLPPLKSITFKIGFHVAVGLAMAVFYAFLVEPILYGPPLLKGILYAIFGWLANAFIVLPLIGEGIAGSHHLTIAGMSYFAFAHTVFFVLQAVLYGRFMKNSGRYMFYKPAS